MNQKPASPYNMPLKLTQTDKAILETYKNLCEGLSEYLGKGYEIVLHSLENLDSSIIKIINGDYTGRREGAPITDLALTMLEKMESGNSSGHISYFTRNKNGALMRSCTIEITGEKGNTIGLLCINLYLDMPFSQLMENFFPSGAQEPCKNNIENFVDTPTELVGDAVCRVREEVFRDTNILARNRNREIIFRLSERGVFRMKDSVTQCANILGISKNTVYMHLRKKDL